MFDAVANASHVPVEGTNINSLKSFYAVFGRVLRPKRVAENVRKGEETKTKNPLNSKLASNYFFFILQAKPQEKSNSTLHQKRPNQTTNFYNFSFHRRFFLLARIHFVQFQRCFGSVSVFREHCNKQKTKKNMGNRRKKTSSS